MGMDLFLIDCRPWFPPVVIVLVSDLLSICFPKFVSQNFCLYLVCNLPLIHSVALLSYNFAFILIQIGVWGRNKYLCSRHHVLSCSVVSNSFATPWTVALQAPLSMGFSRQENWSGLPFPSPGDLPDSGIKPESPVSPVLAGQFFFTVLPGSPVLFFNRRLTKGTD